MAEELPPLVPWDRFYAAWRWLQGEHLTVIGPTGTGKTTLLRAAVRKRYSAGGAVLVLATKPADRKLTQWAREDRLAVVRSWPPRSPWWRAAPADPEPGTPWDRRVMLWPPFRGADDLPGMQAAMRAALTDTFAAGRWCVVAEELHYLAAVLGLSDELITDWTQGRSTGLTLAGATQRPVNVPLYAYSQATHLFFFNDNDEVNLRRVQGLGGLSSSRVRDIVASLPMHDTLYVNTRRRVLVRTRVTR